MCREKREERVSESAYVQRKVVCIEIVDRAHTLCVQRNE